jgi:hypothetical protein
MLLPPVTLYKEFYNIITKRGDHILLNQEFYSDHMIVFWNMVLYFKLLNLPTFILDFDYSPNHLKQHCTSIKKFLPPEKHKAFLGQIKQRLSSSSNMKNLPPRLDQNALLKFNHLNNQSAGLKQDSITVNDDKKSRCGSMSGPDSQRRKGNLSKLTNHVKSIFQSSSSL